ncbi:deoxyribodipyrimidine photo-lyase [Emticicia sp. BO119]|uniref:cryptochrome/photolyase family protein n=1 Tax=Emticicia sp. BO119 TaxID=2757768 RepID=UPI0015F07C3A|nr:deoxyribodipyrimidine photo-lyase [Emticicia sp. BO119]MBA4853335.1 deoxyribodipyrimidine photo-lyase [Emticicia sp. BO119]
MNQKVSIFWFRRDLRLDDNAGLFYALKSTYPILPLFIFDSEILDKLENKYDARVEFIHKSILDLHEQLKELDSSILIKYGKPLEVWKDLIETCTIAEVYTNHDYEQYANGRDLRVGELLNSKGIGFYTYKDQVIFEKNEILTGGNTPYTIFTPYSRKWREKLNEFYVKSYPTEAYFKNFLKFENKVIPGLTEMGFFKTNTRFPEKEIDTNLIEKYNDLRDIPSILGTSRLSVHLRFGTISIRKLVQKALILSQTWLNELIWRDFYMNILYHFPHISKGESFKKEYDGIVWRNNENEFQAWCMGLTGYPIVDAGMRELNETGFMHNRVRMITASFLVKHLLIDWRWGEAYFAEKLLDYDFAANNGGWQWAAGSGCDAAPYFRIFNPTTQTQKFDPELKYIKKWVPDVSNFDYPEPIVEHTFARERVLDAYKKALNKN